MTYVVSCFGYQVKWWCTNSVSGPDLLSSLSISQVFVPFPQASNKHTGPCLLQSLNLSPLSEWHQIRPTLPHPRLQPLLGLSQTNPWSAHCLTLYPVTSPRIMATSPYTPLSTQFPNPPVFNLPHSYQMVSIQQRTSLPSFYHLSTTFNIKSLSLAQSPKILNEGSPPFLPRTFCCHSHAGSLLFDHITGLINPRSHCHLSIVFPAWFICSIPHLLGVPVNNADFFQ